MKKKRIPFFTICALLCAAMLFYINHQKENARKENLESGDQGSARCCGEIAGHADCTDLEEAGAESVERNREQNLEFRAAPEESTSKHTHVHAHTHANTHTHTHAHAHTCTDHEHAHADHTALAKSSPESTQAPVHLATETGDITHDTEIKAQGLTADTHVHAAAPEPELSSGVNAQDSEQKSAQSKSITRTITVKNSITPAMLSYAHWTGTYSPSVFEIEVNGTPLAQGAQTVIPLDKDNSFAVSYHYSFMNGYKTGARKVTFSVDPEKSEPEKHGIVELGFSWKNKWHVISDQATHEFIEDLD